MYKIGQHVMYSNSGICKVLDICTLPHSKNETDLYYTLQPVFQSKSTIYIPVNNEKVFMRSAYTKSEVEELIDSIENLEPLWFSDRKERELMFKETLTKHNTENYMRILKGLYLEKQTKKADGKNLGSSDDSMYNFAENLLFGEFAVVLNISLESVSELIDTHLASVSI